MEQRAVIRFLTLKCLRASAIATEFKSVHETEVIVLSTVKKWRKTLWKGELRHMTTQGVNDPLPTT
jgi:hypothetical protein